MQFATILNYIEYPSYYDQLVAQVSNSYLYVTGKFTNKFVNDLIPINIANFTYATQSYSGIAYNQTYLLYDLIEKQLYSATNINQLIPNIIAIPIYTYDNILFTSYETLINWLSNNFSQINSNTISNLNIDTSTTDLSMKLYDTYINIIDSVTQTIERHTNFYFSNSTIYLSYPYNITNWSTTYSLSLNQALVISFTNSQTLFIPLQLTGNDVYKLYLTQNISSYNSGGVMGGIFLYPNNTSVRVVQTYYGVYYNNGNAYVQDGDFILNALQLGYCLGSTEAIIINNSPFTKTVIFQDVEFGYSFAPGSIISARIWDDYTTNWTMFGTITLPQPSSGFLSIKRIR